MLLFNANSKISAGAHFYVYKPKDVNMHQAEWFAKWELQLISTLVERGFLYKSKRE